MSCGSGCGPGCLGCKILKILVALVLTYTTIGALLGAWAATGGFSMMASSSATLSLLTLAISSTLWLKVVKKLCPCNKGCSCAPGQCHCK